MRRLAWLVCLAVAASLCGCRAPMDLPSGFVELQDPGEGFRAATSDDARLWVREMYDRSDAELGFWVDALKNDLGQRGYEFVAEGDVADSGGAAGRWLEMTANVGGERVAYLVAVWVREPFWLWFWQGGDWLQVVEFAAAQQTYDGYVEAVRKALASVRG